MPPAPPVHVERPFDLRDWVLIALMTVTWGLNVIAVKLALQLTSPLTAAFLRQAIVAVLCLPFLRFVPGRMRVIPLYAVLAGALFYIPINMALAISDNVGALVIAGQMGAPFAVLLSVLFLGEKIRLPRVMGLFLAFTGVMLVGFDPAAIHELPGLALMAGSSLIWAVGSLMTRQMADVRVATLFAWLGLAGVMILGPLALIFEREAMAGIVAMPALAWLWIGFSAIGSTIIGHGGLSILVQRHPIGAVMPYTLIAPILSVIVSYVIFDTPITGMMMLGGVFVLVGVAVITIRTAKRGQMIETPS
ncbi:DMT family transporter [Sphingobium algorifonticola]|uniref:DMT family transporter n=1 Tax=Sphingobium algorifonticola TaxID=2008318 RepID=UPI0030BA229A